MDFLGGLPKTQQGHDYLLVMVDSFSKMTVLIPCKKTISGQEEAKLFFQNVWVHFGLPESIISDRDSRFLSHFWTTLWGMMDTKLKRSTAFHPQTDGQTEVVNRILVDLLRGYNRKHPKTWDESLPYIQHCYNRAIHSSSNKSPFETCLGFLPQTPFDISFAKSTEDKSMAQGDERQKSIKFMEQIQQVQRQVEEQLQRAQQRYKERHDRHRTVHDFKEGDMIWLHLSKKQL